MEGKRLGNSQISFDALKAKVRWVTKETLLLHKRAPETRLASSLSNIEILVTLYYGGFLRVDGKAPLWKGRDRFLSSKGHGTVSIYPILADLGFFDRKLLEDICREKSLLAGIPDTRTPGIETINGSLGHGLGVACGMAISLKRKKSDSRVFVLCGDGELNEGAMWEAVIFAAYHRLDNLLLIVDDNKKSMLGFQKDILGMSPLEEKFAAFGWIGKTADGHDLRQLDEALRYLLNADEGKPRVLVANTVKGKGVGVLEADPLSHVRTLSAEEVDKAIEAIE